MSTDLGLTGPDKAAFYEAQARFNEQDWEEALKGGEDLLNRHADNIYVMSMVADSLLKLDRFGLAYGVFQRLTELDPNIWQFWNNLGRCYEEMVRFDEAIQCFRRCLHLAPGEFAPLRNMLLTAIYQCRWDDAISFAGRAVESATSADQVRRIDQDMAPVHFAKRDWKEGWRTYELDLGGKYRRDKPYKNEPRWNGESGKTVIIYGEQGIGDEVMFASMYGDALSNCNGILECDRRLVGLFQRSFPGAAAVYGTRHDRDLYWPARNQFDARVAAGSLGRLYRSGGNFPRTPYLVADPVRRIGWRAILDTLPGKKIGIAWTGGQWNTRSVERSVGLGDLAAGLAGANRTLVSLQYRDASADNAEFEAATGIKVHQFAHATLTKNYDDVAALVAELDAVVSVTTAVALLSGALGKETHVLVPEHPTWHWAESGEMPWVDVNLYRKSGPSWAPSIQQIAEAL